MQLCLQIVSRVVHILVHFLCAFASMLKHLSKILLHLWSMSFVLIVWAIAWWTLLSFLTENRSVREVLWCPTERNTKNDISSKRWLSWSEAILCWCELLIIDFIWSKLLDRWSQWWLVCFCSARLHLLLAAFSYCRWIVMVVMMHDRVVNVLLLWDFDIDIHIDVYVLLVDCRLNVFIILKTLLAICESGLVSHLMLILSFLCRGLVLCLSGAIFFLPDLM